MAKSNKTAVEISLGLDYESSYSAIVEGLKKIIADIEGQSWTTIKLKADVSSFKKSVKEATEAAGGVTKSTESASKSTANLQKKMQDTATATDAVAKGADAASAAVSNVQQTMEGTAAATDAVAKGADTASSAVSGVQMSLEEAAGATAGITQGTDAASQSAHVLKDDVDMVAQALEEASQDTNAASEGTSGFREKMEASAEAAKNLRDQLSDAKQMLSELVATNLQSKTDVGMQELAAQYTELVNAPSNPDQTVEDLQKVVEAIREASKTTEDYKAEFEGLQYQVGVATDKLLETVPAAEQETDAFQKMISVMREVTSMTFDPTQAVSGINTVKDALNTLTHNTDEYQNAYEKLQTKVLRLAQNNANLTSTNKDAAAAVKELQDLAAKGFDWGHPEQSVKELEEALNKCSQRLSQAGIEANTFEGRMKRAFSTQIVQRLTASISTMLMSALKSVYDNVVKIESAMAQLEIVTKATGSELSDVADRIAKSAASIGVSVSALTESVTTYARLGFGMDEAATFAELTAMYSRVAEITVNDATTNLTSVIKAFNVTADELEGVLDELITVGNNFAVSSAELGDALNNAASALAANGNSLEETLGIIAAANATVQDIDKASTAVRTIAARLSNSTAELVELGEDTYDVMATAALAESMRAYNIEIMNADGSLKSTYEILGLIADEWENLNNTEQAAIAKMVAGTRQQSIFYSIIENWDDATAAVEMCEDATGELEESYEIYLDTMEGRLAQLSAAWESFSESFMQTDFMKDLVQMITSALEGLTSLVSGFSNLHVTTVAITVVIVYLIELLGKRLVKAFSKATQSATTFGDKLKTIFTSGGTWTAILTVLMLVNSLLSESESQVASLITTTLVGIAAITVAILALNNVITKGPLVIIMAIITALTAIVELFNVIVNWESKQEKQLRKLREQTDEWVESWKNLTSQLEDVNSELDDTLNNIIELVELGLGEEGIDAERALAIARGEESADLTGLTTDDVKTLSDYIKEYDELNEQQEVLAAQEAAAAEEARKSAADYLAETANSTMKYVDGVLNRQWWQSYAKVYAEDEGAVFRELARTSEEIGRDLAGTTLDWMNLMLANYDILSDAQKEWLQTQIDTFDEYGSILVWYSQEEIDALQETLEEGEENWKQTSNDMYLAYHEMYDRMTVAMVDNPFETIWRSLGVREYYQDSVEYLNELAAAYKTTEDELTIDLLRSIAATDEGVAELFEYLQDLGLVFLDDDVSLQQFINSLDSLAKSVDASGYIKGFTHMADDIADAYELLADALDDLADLGIVSIETINKMLEDYPDLAAMFEISEDLQGYVLTDEYAMMSEMEILEQYMTDYVQEYQDRINEFIDQRIELEKQLAAINEEDIGSTQEWAEVTYELAQIEEELAVAYENLQTAEAYAASTLREREIDYLTDLLEQEEDLLDSQLDNYKDLIDMRKELLKTYKEELDYYKELYSRQKKVSDLQTQYAVAQLDTSAAGQARQRSLLEQLNTAEEDLEDYTLEHAIDVITAHLDAEYDEYEKYLNKKIAEIVDAINNVGQGLKITFSADDAYGDYSYGNITAEVSYHEGGFVGGVSTLASNEEFAKLLEGEFVATPQMMERFMKQTMPEIAGAGTGDINNYNSPLIEINCDSITEDSLPTLERIVDEAAQRLKAELDSGVARRGYRSSTNLSL